MQEPSDHRLLRAYGAGNRSAFDAMFRRYAPRIHATALRLTGNWDDAEDVLQETFIRLAAKAGTIRRGEALRAWLYRTAVNLSTDHLRARRKTVSLDTADAQAAAVVAVLSLRDEAERREAGRRELMMQQIEALVPRLPERQGAVFVLRRFQGLSHREIAEVLKCSEAASKMNHSLACRAIRTWIEAERRREEAGRINREAGS